MAELDLRVVSVSIDINGRLTTFTDLQISAVGIKFANANQNECVVTISNLDKPTQDFLLTETSPFNLNRTPKRLILEAGRVSYGTSRIYVGNIVSASLSQPPDVKMTLKCLTGNFLKGNIVSIFKNFPISLEDLSSYVARQLGLGFQFQAQNRLLKNYNFSGSALSQVDLLAEMGIVNAYIDDDTLVIRDENVPLQGSVRVLNIDSGLIGIPEITEFGVRVRYLVDNETKLGGRLILTSTIYPALSGSYLIYKLNFEINSRDTPFYYIAECKRIV